MTRAGYIPVVFLLALVGCRDPNMPDLVPVSGTVSQNGQPLSGVLVQFIPVDGAPGSGGAGRTDAEGQYQLRTMQGDPGIPAGEYKVTLAKLVMPDGSDFPEGSDVAPIDSAARQVLPAQYSEPRQTELHASITGPSDDVDFELP